MCTLSTDVVLVKCEACEGEGRIYQREDYYDHQYGWQPGERDTGACPWCEGTGHELVPCQPATLEDLDELGHYDLTGGCNV